MATTSSQLLSFTNSGYADDKGGYIRQTALNSSSSSGKINFTGLGTGTDMNEVVDQLVEVESIQMNRLKNWKTTWESKIEAITALNQRLLAVEQGAEDMSTMNKFLVRQVASSNSTVLSAQVNDTAALGAYQVTVGGGDANPIKHIFRSVGFDSLDSQVSDGYGMTHEMTLRVGDQDITFQIAPETTLEQLVSNINAASNGLIKATIENDGTSSNPYHLVLTSGVGGSDGRITAVKNPTWISFDSSDMMLDSNAGDVPVTVSGMYTGYQENAHRALYEMTLDSVPPGNTFTIGQDKFTITWKAAWDNEELGNITDPARIHTIEVPASYKPGDPIEVADGIVIELDAKEFNASSSFVVRAFSGNIDKAETASDWSGPDITTEGHYLGSINKTYNFVVETSGTVNGNDARYLTWSDSTGKTGRVKITALDEAVEVEQGVYIKLDSGGSTSLVQGQRFSLDVYAQDLQQAQDKGVAQAAKAVHSGFSDYDISPVTTSDSTFSYTYGGHVINVPVEAGMTLSQLAVAINEDKNNPGVKATYINDGLGLPNSWKLVLTGSKTGQEYQITNISHDFKGSNFGGGGDLGGGFTTAQRATNSMIKVDGYPMGDEYLQRPYNQVADAITGVNLNITDCGTSVVTISVDNSAVADKVEAFINAVNMAQDYIREATMFQANSSGDYSTTADQEHNAGILIGNYAFYIIKTEIDNLLATKPTGLVAGKDTFTLLAEIGIESDPNNNGVWVLDKTKLSTALGKDPEGVAKLFIGVPDPNSTDKDDQQWLSKGVAQRTYEKIKELTASPSTKLDDKTGQAINVPGGPLNVLISNYNDIISNIDKRIVNEEKRIAIYRERTRLRFARLETTIAQMNSNSSAIESAISGLPKTSNSSSK